MSLKSCTLMLLSIPLFAAAPLTAVHVDLNRETIHVRSGFDASWTRGLPSPGDSNWLAVPGITSGTRSVVLMELPLKGMPERRMFSLKEYPPMNFTFLTAFTMTNADLAPGALKGVYFQNIGENWEVYLNGTLLKSEVHLDANGRITRYRHWRDVLISIDPRLLIEGKNILAVRIIGDPTNIDSGFHRSTPFIIDDLELLRLKRSDRTSLVFIFLYLFFGSYHLFIYLKKRSARYNFYYGAFSVMLFIYLISRSYTIYCVIADSTVLHRIEYCSLYALIPLFGAFADLLLVGTYGRVTKAYAALYAVLIAVTALPVSNPFAIDVLRVWQVSAIFALAYYTFIRIGGPVAGYFRELYGYAEGRAFPARVLVPAWRSLTNSMAGNLMLGTLVMVGCAVFDILDSMFWAYDYVLTAYGFFAFTLGITLILANRFIEIHNTLETTNDSIRSEMEIAAYIQRSLLPSAPRSADWDIALEYRPLHGPSGDFFDFYMKGDRLEGLAVFDVSGHGISSALVTMIVKPITYRAFTRSRNAGLEKTIALVDQRMAEEFPESENIITCALLRFRGSGVEYVNAGHPNLLLKSGADGSTKIIDNGGKKFRSVPLGAHISDEPPTVLKFGVRKGDTLVLYTDCLIECVGKQGERFDIGRLIASLDESPGASAREILDHVLGSFHAFIDHRRIRDDLTVIVARKKT